MPERYAAFLSYAHRYRPWVEVLQKNLESCLAAAGRSEKIFLDATDLGSGRSWVGQLQVGLSQAEQLVLVVTPEALASSWVVNEWQSFVASRSDWHDGRLHLAILVDTPLPPFFSRIQHVDFQVAGEPGYFLAIQRLAAGLLGKTGRLDGADLPSGLVPPPPVESGLPPALRGRLIDALAPILAKRLLRFVIAPQLGFPPERLETQPDLRSAASAALVWAAGDEAPVAAAMRVVATVAEALGDDEPAWSAPLASLREELQTLQRKKAEDGRLAVSLRAASFDIPTPPDSSLTAVMEPPFHVFISHNSRDKLTVREICEALRERGLQPWLAEEELIPGRDWQEALEEAVRTVPAAAVLVGRDGIGPWEDREMRACLLQFVDRRIPVIPVLLPGAARKPALPLFLQAFTWVDLRNGITRQGIDRLVYGITGEKPPAPPPKPSHGVRTEPVVGAPAAAERSVTEDLAEAYRRKEELTIAGGDTRAVEREILDLRRELREGGRLQAGDFLADGRFRLVEPLGSGGFAAVWKAYDKKEHRLVAVKVLHGQHGADRTRLERFFRGARKMAELHHPGIVRVLDRQLDDGGYHFFVMEFVPGGDLRQAVLEKRLAPERVLPLLAEVAMALDFAHQKGVVHRDVKPANVLLDAEGRPKLTDFDLVRAFDTTGGTLGGGMMGTFLYTAPEVMQEPQEAGVTADVYSLAMTAAFCLSGKELPVEVLRDTGKFLHRLACPAVVRAALEKAAAWEPERRFSSVAEFTRALKEWRMSEQ
ncbi:MAG TPA: TIR domain-containing protein, partial [Thermoanaerobaculia bacterium]|nr:TIR domain-containing protein [Thermoanaerobaculia bacterium]